MEKKWTNFGSNSNKKVSFIQMMSQTKTLCIAKKINVESIWNRHTVAKIYMNMLMKIKGTRT